MGPPGGVAEWLKAAVLKTANPQGFVGSNPTASASNHLFSEAGDVTERLKVRDC